MAHKQGRFFWNLFTGNVVLLLAVVGACVLLIAKTFDASYDSILTDHLHTVARMLRNEYGDALHAGNVARLAEATRDLDANTVESVRVTFIDAAGRVLGDSQAEAARMESHADRDEVRQAMRDGIGERTRFSTTIQKEMKYVALRVGPADAPVGVVRVAMPLGSIVARTRAARWLFWRMALVVSAAAVVLALGLARMWSGRIARVTATARQLSRGDLSARADEGGSDEVALLARSLNRMRDHQAVQLATIERHRRGLEYLLAKLQEGVLAADATGRITLMNPAAARLLGIPMPADAREQELARGTVAVAQLPEAVATLLLPDRRRSLEEVVERELTLEREQATTTLLARVSELALPESDTGHPAAPGRLLVLTDITELTRTIKMRTDFVANASHELRTPLTAIRAAIDTLIALDEDGGPAADQRAPLLDVLDRHSERLVAIVADLLDLSRVETATQRYAPVELDLPAVIDGLRARFQDRLTRQRLDFRVDLAADADAVLANPELLEIVLDNLVDNAIKFTDEGGWIAVSSARDNGRIGIGVADNGCGIPQQEQDRVFERFYQVERARTGQRRGTGLGLAIVRHATSAMNGQVELSSTPGAGTRFTVLLPPAGPQSELG
jgi:two-component system phosphate regulon sensor histidine kinase PhoR